jgi:hypothetical protein
VGAGRKRDGGGGSNLTEQGCSTHTPLRNAAGLFNSVQIVPFGVWGSTMGWWWSEHDGGTYGVGLAVGKIGHVSQVS